MATTEAENTELELVFEGEDDVEAYPLVIGADKRAIRTKSVDPEITSLYERWKRGKLILQPDFQRQFVWDRSKASRLIESILLSVPLPIIYLAEEPDGRESVIDGQQRLTSFFSFIDGTFPDGKPFKLSGMTLFSELNRKAFSELSEEYQDKIKYYEIRTITILKDSDPDLKFDIFQRLNTGAVALNDMELRNCVYRGPYMELLKDLAQDEAFRKVLGFKRPDKRMRDVELVLRFASFYHATYLKYVPPMKRFFNSDMEMYQYIGDSATQELRSAFRNSLQLTWSLFGENAFRRFHAGTEENPNGEWEKTRFNASLYDVLMGVLCEVDKNRVYGSLDSLREALIDLMTSNPDFVESILIGTSDRDRVRKRFDLVRATVELALKAAPQQERCFSLKLKQSMYDEDPTCGLCGQRIQSLDDAAMDHIEQYWRGGQTVPENARLAHRFCNNSRPRRED